MIVKIKYEDDGSFEDLTVLKNGRLGDGNHSSHRKGNGQARYTDTLIVDPLTRHRGAFRGDKET